MSRWENFLVREDANLVDAARIIDAGGGQIALVVDDQRRLLGTITDADLRRALLAGSDFQMSCTHFMCKTPISAPITHSREECRKIMVKRHIGQLPIIDVNGCIVDVILMTEMYLPDEQPNPVVIMAGGLGSRLGDLTRNTPKPMLNIGGRPLLETIIDQMVQQGFSKFFLTVNFKADIIINHFQDGLGKNISIEYLHEKKRLGTAGSLHMLPKNIEDDIIVMNGDILSRVDARRLLLTHRRMNSIATMSVKDFDLTIPYGVVDMDEDSNIKGFSEKPVTRHFINAGIYALSPRALNYVPEDKFFDMPSLFNACREAGENTRAYPLREYWIDIGHLKDFDRANFEFSEHF